MRVFVASIWIQKIYYAYETPSQAFETSSDSKKECEHTSGYDMIRKHNVEIALKLVLQSLLQAMFEITTVIPEADICMALVYWRTKITTF